MTMHVHHVGQEYDVFMNYISLMNLKWCSVMLILAPHASTLTPYSWQLQVQAVLAFICIYLLVKNCTWY